MVQGSDSDLGDDRGRASRRCREDAAAQASEAGRYGLSHAGDRYGLSHAGACREQHAGENENELCGSEAASDCAAVPCARHS